MKICFFLLTIFIFSEATFGEVYIIKSRKTESSQKTTVKTEGNVQKSAVEDDPLDDPNLKRKTVEVQASDNPMDDPVLNKENSPFGNGAAGEALEKTGELASTLFDKTGQLKADALEKLKESFSNKEMIKDLLRENQQQLNKVTEEALEKMVISRLPKKVQDFLTENPKILRFSVRLIKDSHALPALVDGMQNKKKITVYFACIIASFILGFILKRKNRKKDQFILKEIFKSLVITLFVICFNLSAFYIVFREDLRPTIEVWNSIG